MSTFAIPNEKRGAQNLKFGNEKFIEKTDYCTRSKYREKYNLSRSVNFFGNQKCQRQAKNYILIYNEEFDPGSG